MQIVLNDQVMMKGNEALAEAAVRAGCRAYFGYPITPQTEVMEYLARRLPEAGGVFLQAESEVAAINMVYGASGAGARVMTSSSGPGISLKQEGISFLACAELPCVIVNVMRGGPGLGSIQASQADYFQATRGGGHGDYRIPVLAPSSVQEMADLAFAAFDLADRWRTPVLVLSDGVLGQMMEPVRLPEEMTGTMERPWVTDGCRGRERRIVKTLYLDSQQLEAHNRRLQAKYVELAAQEARSECYRTEGAEVLIVAFGICARVARTAVDNLRDGGVRAGLFRPVTLWPFPSSDLKAAAAGVEAILTVELNAGQMVDDVRLTLPGAGRALLRAHGRHRRIRIGNRSRSAEDSNGESGGMKRTAFTHPRTLTAARFHYCPGCGHGVAHRLVAEVIDELKLRERTVGVAPVGCSILMYNYMDLDMQEAAHGRAPAVATGIKRVLPDRIVFSYQGDGDLASIGTAEIIHAAARGENITVIFINNTNYGMTGGQMAPTTLPGQKTTTSPLGTGRAHRRASPAHGRTAVRPGRPRVHRPRRDVQPGGNVPGEEIHQESVSSPGTGSRLFDGRNPVRLSEQLGNGSSGGIALGGGADDRPLSPRGVQGHDIDRAGRRRGRRAGSFSAAVELSGRPIWFVRCCLRVLEGRGCSWPGRCSPWRPWPKESR